MKYIISERQYKLIVENQKEEILYIPSVKLFGDWETLQKFLERKGNPLFGIEGDLNLRDSNIKSLGNLTSVGEGLDLGGTPLSKKYSVAQIRQMVNVGEVIYV